MELRRAVPADASRLQYVAELAYAPYLERMDGVLPGPLRTDYAVAVADTEAWVASVDGAVVGFLLLVPEDDAMLIDNVAVLPSHHGRGLGRALLLLAEERATASGRTRIRLYTHVTMVENQRLYERTGYVETHRGGEPGLERVFYEKRLDPPHSVVG
jgi:ribosomal protein S18 acetylase RimI-like enzyme